MNLENSIKRELLLKPELGYAGAVAFENQLKMDSMFEELDKQEQLILDEFEKRIEMY